MYGITPLIISFITESMKNWKTTLHLNHNNGSLTSRCIMIKSGIFEGDSLSPLLFCLTLAPLSSLINESTYGYHTQGHKITQLLYMDDLKMYAKNDNQQIDLLSIVKKFSDNIKMEYGVKSVPKHHSKVVNWLKH